jgi:hypothetical protein
MTSRTNIPSFGFSVERHYPFGGAGGFLEHRLFVPQPGKLALVWRLTDDLGYFLKVQVIDWSAGTPLPASLQDIADMRGAGVEHRYPIMRADDVLHALGVAYHLCNPTQEVTHGGNQHEVRAM